MAWPSSRCLIVSSGRRPGCRQGTVLACRARCRWHLLLSAPPPNVRLPRPASPAKCFAAPLHVAKVASKLGRLARAGFAQGDDEQKFHMFEIA